MLVPGLGQLFVRAYRRAFVLLALTLAIALAGVALTLAHPSLDLRLLLAILLLDTAMLALRVFAVVDAGRSAAPLFVAVLVVVTVAPHAAAGYLAVRSYTVLDHVFAHAEPNDVLPSRGIFITDQPLPDPAPALPRGKALAAASPLLADVSERPWTTILLLGTDEGPGNWGARTDTIILVALEHGTRRAAAFGIPRNLVHIPVGGKLPIYHQPINGLYSFVRAYPDLLPPAHDPGASALKLAVSQLLGVRVDYYALVNLRGFADLVDALGGVTIHVKERVHDSVTRAAWGEPKPRIDVYPGHTYHLDGHQSLAYVRSRKDSDDYARMTRQRCFLSALADELDPLSVLRNFGSIARTVEHNVRTDIPLDRLPSLVKLATAVSPRSTVTVTFGRDYILRRRKTDDFPLPDVAHMRATAREALLNPTAATTDGSAALTHASC